MDYWCLPPISHYTNQKTNLTTFFLSCLLPQQVRIMATIVSGVDPSSDAQISSAKNSCELDEQRLAPGTQATYSKQVSWYIPGPPCLPGDVKTLLENWSDIGPENGGAEGHVERMVSMVYNLLVEIITWSCLRFPCIMFHSACLLLVSISKWLNLATDAMFISCLFFLASSLQDTRREMVARYIMYRQPIYFSQDRRTKNRSMQLLSNCQK